MAKRDIVVIGASAGGVSALTELIRLLPRDFNASVFIVLHLSPFSKSYLPDILTRQGQLTAIHPKDGEMIRPGAIYVAPPDHHILIEKDSVLVKRGPKENRFRPSIDALFRSAAYEYGPRVIGIVLSGLLDDGTSGMWTIKRLGGVCVIQDPAEAIHPSMPESVMKFVNIDYQLGIEKIAPLLQQLCASRAPKKPKLSPEETKRIKTEIAIAAEKNAFDMGIIENGKPTILTCPECNGALLSFQEGKRKRYRCHTGHAFVPEALLNGVTKAVEEDLWKAIKGLEESILLLEEIAQSLDQSGQREAARESRKKAMDIRKRSRLLHKNVFHYEHTIDPTATNGNGKIKGKTSRRN